MDKIGNRFLFVACLLSSSLAAAPQTPSTPKKKRARDDTAERDKRIYETPTNSQRKREMPAAPKKRRQSDSKVDAQGFSRILSEHDAKRKSPVSPRTLLCFSLFEIELNSAK